MEQRMNFNHICNIMSKRQDILPTRASIFISSARKTKRLQKLKIKFFE